MSPARATNFYLFLFCNLRKFPKNVFFCLLILAEGSKIPTYAIPRSPALKSFLIGIGNGNKGRLEAVSIYPYLE